MRGHRDLELSLSNARTVSDHWGALRLLLGQAGHPRSRGTIATHAPGDSEPGYSRKVYGRRWVRDPNSGAVAV